MWNSVPLFQKVFFELKNLKYLAKNVAALSLTLQCTEIITAGQKRFQMPAAFHNDTCIHWEKYYLGSEQVVKMFWFWCKDSSVDEIRLPICLKWCIAIRLVFLSLAAINRATVNWRQCFAIKTFLVKCWNSENHETCRFPHKHLWFVIFRCSFLFPATHVYFRINCDVVTCYTTWFWRENNFLFRTSIKVPVYVAEKKHQAASCVHRRQIKRFTSRDQNRMRHGKLATLETQTQQSVL